MAFIRFNEAGMILDIVTGVDEEYIPTKDNIDLSFKVANLRSKMEEWNQKEKDFMLNEISPALQEIRDQIVVLNEKTYPKLKLVREQREQENK